MTAGEQIISLDVDSHETVENVKALLEVESNVPIQKQQLLYNGNETRNSDKLSALGVKDDDLLMMMVSNTSSRLLRLTDQRYKGIAHGVGTSEILGRIHVAPIKIGNNFYPCSFVVLDSPNMEFLFGLDMLRKHQCTIDLKNNVLTVGGGEVSVPFLQEQDIPSRFLDEERVPNQASSSGQAVRSSASCLITHLFAYIIVKPQGAEYEEKIAKLVELGFSREAVIQALGLFQGNEEQAAGFLFGG
ncbi:unnamed protein product [Cochlearia groenlandica]